MSEEKEEWKCKDCTCEDCTCTEENKCIDCKCEEEDQEMKHWVVL
mgnify:CR=1 FL=1|tara:strand:- start:24 stop:158 length:135 start_codon:yes stop_codon:yes gene_type:complete